MHRVCASQLLIRTFHPVSCNLGGTAGRPELNMAAEDSPLDQLKVGVAEQVVLHVLGVLPLRRVSYIPSDRARHLVVCRVELTFFWAAGLSDERPYTSYPAAWISSYASRNPQAWLVQPGVLAWGVSLLLHRTRRMQPGRVVPLARVSH